VATIGPACKEAVTIGTMLEVGMSIARLNFSWGTHTEHAQFVATVRQEAVKRQLRVPIIQDLSGPRIKTADGGHSFATTMSVITDKDRTDMAFTVACRPEYVALSFVRSATDICELYELLLSVGSDAKVIAKIERPEALIHLDEIITQADGIMIARGDLGENIPFETVPFVEKEILQKCRVVNKPVIVATEMLTSMLADTEPSRADITDIAQAVIDGASATMLSNETAIGAYPVEVVSVMRKVVDEALLHNGDFSTARF